jgi:hypothetical protein
MKFMALAGVILSLTCAVQVIGQEALHMNAGSERGNISFTADSIARQDPPEGTVSAYASTVLLKGHVVIRACCMQKGLAEGSPKQAMFIHADEAEYHQHGDEIEIHGNARVSFENYPK